MATRNERRRKAAAKEAILREAVADAFALEAKREAAKAEHAELVLLCRPNAGMKAWAPGDVKAKGATGKSVVRRYSDTTKAFWVDVGDGTQRRETLSLPRWNRNA